MKNELEKQLNKIKEELFENMTETRIEIDTGAENGADGRVATYKRTYFNNKRLENKHKHIKNTYRHLADTDLLTCFCRDSAVEGILSFSTDVYIKKHMPKGISLQDAVLKRAVYYIDKTIHKQLQDWTGAIRSQPVKEKGTNERENIIYQPVPYMSLDETIKVGDENLKVEETVTADQNIFSIFKPEKEDIRIEELNRIAEEHLTKKQRRVLKLLLEGHTQKKIAKMLGVKQSTISEHQKNIIEVAKKHIHIKTDRQLKIEELERFLDELQDERDVIELIERHIDDDLFTEATLYEVDSGLVKQYLQRKSDSDLKEFCRHYLNTIYTYIEQLKLFETVKRTSFSYIIHKSSKKHIEPVKIYRSDAKEHNLYIDYENVRYFYLETVIIEGKKRKTKYRRIDSNGHNYEIEES